MAIVVCKYNYILHRIFAIDLLKVPRCVRYCRSRSGWEEKTSPSWTMSSRHDELMHDREKCLLNVEISDGGLLKQPKMLHSLFKINHRLNIPMMIVDIRTTV